MGLGEVARTIRWGWGRWLGASVGVGGLRILVVQT